VGEKVRCESCGKLCNLHASGKCAECRELTCSDCGRKFVRTSGPAGSRCSTCEHRKYRNAKCKGVAG
jgi:DNA-directed RNA polymerase subunit RPC12/RpoP